MSFNSDINGFNSNAIQNLYSTQNENKEDYTGVDFCVNDYSAELFDCNSEIAGNGSDEFAGNGFSDLGGNGFVEFGGNGFEEFGGNGFEDIGGNGFKDLGGNGIVDDYMADYNFEENQSTMEFEG